MYRKALVTKIWRGDPDRVAHLVGHVLQQQVVVPNVRGRARSQRECEVHKVGRSGVKLQQFPGGVHSVPMAGLLARRWNVSDWRSALQHRWTGRGHGRVRAPSPPHRADHQANPEDDPGLKGTHSEVIMAI